MAQSHKLDDTFLTHLFVWTAIALLTIAQVAAAPLLASTPRLF